MPRFSIVVPVYNVGAFLPDCIGSIVGQSCDDYEIVLVNDGSTDESASLCEMYKEELGSRVTLVTQENAGLLMARRAGFRAAHGDVFVSVDGDDMLRTDALEIISEVFDEHGVDVVLYGVSRKADFSTIADGYRPFHGDRMISNAEKPELLRLLCTGNSLNSMCSKAIVRRAMDIDDSYKNYRGLCSGEDLMQSFAVFDKLDNAYYVDRPLYYYRVNYGSLTKRFDESRLADQNCVERLRMKYAAKWEREYGIDGLVFGAMIARLNSYAMAAQAASEGLDFSDAVRFLVELATSDDFKEAYSYRGNRNLLRRDFKIITELLYRGEYRRIFTFCKLKSLMRRVIVKR